MNSSRFSMTLTAIGVALALAGCDVSGGDTQVQAAHDRERSKADWKLTVEWAGGRHELPIERMDIFLTEDEEYPEIFEMLGEGLALVGEFPAGVSVDYDEAHENLIGKTVMIAPSGGDPREPKQSFVTLGGMRVPVLGGTFTVEQTRGKWAGSDGNKTISGTIELRIPGEGGETTIRGRFASHAVSWG